jgi:hypothetical protein
VLDGAVAMGIEDVNLLANLAYVLEQLGDHDSARAMLARSNQVGVAHCVQGAVCAAAFADSSRSLAHGCSGQPGTHRR